LDGLESYTPDSLVEFDAKRLFRCSSYLFTVPKSGKELFYGEVAEINTYRQRVTFKYLDIYGDEKVIERKMVYVTPLTDEQYEEKMAEQAEEIEKYKYEIGAFAIWKDKGASLFGVIRLLNDKSHKATIEYLDI
jgi:hypothetical protein